MAKIRGEIKRGCLNQIYAQAQPDKTALTDALNAFQAAAFQEISTGRFVVANAGNGHSVQFQVPQFGKEVTQEEIMAFSQELVEVYAAALITLSSQGNGNPNDAQILPVMMADDRLQSITEYQQDYTILRWPARY